MGLVQASVGVVRCVWVGDHAVFHAILRCRTPRFLYDTLELDGPKTRTLETETSTSGDTGSTVTGKGFAYIACHGSFNPVHRHHVEIMVKAKMKLESEGYKVIAGVLAPTHFSHLARKGVQAVLDAHRFQVLCLACEEAEGEPKGWLRSDTRGVHYGSCYKMMKNLLSFEFPSATGFEVKGADNVVHYNSYWYELQNPCIIFARAGTTAELMRGFQEASAETGGPEGKSTYVVEAELPGDLSSTKIRECLLFGDIAGVREMCSQRVADYLWKHRATLFSGHT